MSRVITINKYTVIVAIHENKSGYMVMGPSGMVDFYSKKKYGKEAEGIANKRRETLTAYFGDWNEKN